MSTSPAQLVQLARGAGFSAGQARIMAAIALAESGGNAGAVGDVSLANSTWGPSIGLWQIRSLHAHRGTGKERDAQILTDPARNAQSARIIYGQQGYRAWSVYSSGAYAKHLAAVDAAVTTPAAPPRQLGDPGGRGEAGPIVTGSGVIPVVGEKVQDAAGGVLGGLDAVGAFFGALGQRGTWVRVLQVVGGSGMVVAGLTLLGKDVAGAAVKVAADVVPAGRAAKAAGAVASAAK